MMHDFFAEHPLLLAPMAGVTDEAFRALCREQGASLAYTEMVSAKGLSFANEKTRHLLRLAPGENLVAVQLFGHEPAVMAEQAAWIEHTMGDTLAYLDINMGCPARKIVTKGDGSALMCDPALAASIVSAVRDAVNHPVTVKFRRGFKIGRRRPPNLHAGWKPRARAPPPCTAASPSSSTAGVLTGTSSRRSSAALPFRRGKRGRALRRRCGRPS